MSKANFRANGVDLQEMNSHVYFGQVNVRYNLQSKIARRRAAGWRRFYSIIVVLKSSSPKVHMTTTKDEENMLEVTQIAIKRRALSVSP